MKQTFAVEASNDAALNLPRQGFPTSKQQLLGRGRDLVSDGNLSRHEPAISHGSEAGAASDQQIANGQCSRGTAGGALCETRSFSEIRQRYCKLKEKVAEQEMQQESNQKIIDEWAEQDRTRVEQDIWSQAGASYQVSSGQHLQAPLAAGAPGAASSNNPYARSKTAKQTSKRTPDAYTTRPTHDFPMKPNDPRGGPTSNPHIARRRSGTRLESPSLATIVGAHQINSVQFIPQNLSNFASPTSQAPAQKQQFLKLGISDASWDYSRPSAQERQPLAVAPTRGRPVATNLTSYNSKKTQSPVAQVFNNALSGSVLAAAQASALPAEGYTEYFSHGSDSLGQLGHAQRKSDPNRQRQTSVPKSLSFDILISQVACGAAHTLIVSQRGELFSMGSNQYGQLGLNDRHLDFTTAPLLVHSVKKMRLQVGRVAAGRNHNLLLTQDGQIYSWGCNAYGQCGQLIRQHQKLHMPFKLFSPALGGGQNGRNEICQIDCGDYFSGFLDSLGKVYAFGDNSEGQLGVGIVNDRDGLVQAIEEPREMQTDVRVMQISFGFRHALLLSRSYEVYGCGLNANFELGQGHLQPQNPSNILNPVKIQGLENSKVKKVIAGAFSGAIDHEEQIFIWGQGEFGLIKRPQKLYMENAYFKDCLISKFPNDQIGCQVSSFAIALDTKGKVYSWGSNTHGQLGHGDEKDRKLPSQILQLKKKAVSQISIGGDFVIMLGKDVKLHPAQQDDESTATLDRNDLSRKPFDSQVLEQFQRQNQLLFENEDKTLVIHDQNQSVLTAGNATSHDQSMLQGGAEQLLHHYQLHDQTNPYMNSIEAVEASQIMNRNVNALSDDSFGYPETQNMSLLSKQSHLNDHVSRTQHGHSVDHRGRAAQQNQGKPGREQSPDLYGGQSVNNQGRRGYSRLSVLQGNEKEPLAPSNLPLSRAPDSQVNDTQMYSLTTDNRIQMSPEQDSGDDLGQNQNCMPLQAKDGRHQSRARSGAGRAGSNPRASSIEDRRGTDPNDYYIYKLQAQNLQLELARARAETAEARKETEYVQRHLDKLKEGDVETRKEIQAVIDDREAVDRRVSEKSIDLRKCEMKCQRLEGELTQQKGEFESQANDLNAQISQMKAEHDRASKAKEEHFMSQAEGLKQQLVHYQTTLCEQTQLLEQCQGVQTQNARLQAQVIGLTKAAEENKVLSQQMNDKGKQISTLQSQVSSVKKDQEASTSQVASLQSQVGELNGTVDRLRSEHSKATASMQQSSQKTSKNLNSKIMNLQVQLKQKEKESADRQERIDSLLREATVTNEARGKNTADMQSTFQRQVSQLQELNQRLEEKLGDYEFKNQQLQAAVGEKAQQIQSYIRGVESQCLQKSEILQENERLDEIIGELNERNQELSEMLGQTMYVQAESFKQKVLGTLTKDRLNGAAGTQMERKERLSSHTIGGFSSMDERASQYQQPGTEQEQIQMTQGYNRTMAFENQSAATRHPNDHLNAYHGGLDLSAGAEAEGTLQQHTDQGFFRSIEDPNQYHQLSFQDKQIHNKTCHIEDRHQPGTAPSPPAVQQQYPRNKVHSHNLASIVDNLPTAYPSQKHQRQDVQKMQRYASQIGEKLVEPPIYSDQKPAKLTAEEVRQLDNRRRLEQLVDQEQADRRAQGSGGDLPTQRQQYNLPLQYNSMPQRSQSGVGPKNDPPAVRSGPYSPPTGQPTATPAFRGEPTSSHHASQPPQWDPSLLKNQYNTIPSPQSLPASRGQATNDQARKPQLYHCRDPTAGHKTKHHRHVLDQSFKKIQDILQRTNQVNDGPVPPSTAGNQIAPETRGRSREPQTQKSQDRGMRIRTEAEPYSPAGKKAVGDQWAASQEPTVRVSTAPPAPGRRSKARPNKENPEGLAMAEYHSQDPYFRPGTSAWAGASAAAQPGLDPLLVDQGYNAMHLRTIQQN